METSNQDRQYFTFSQMKQVPPHWEEVEIDARLTSRTRRRICGEYCEFTKRGGKIHSVKALERVFERTPRVTESRRPSLMLQKRRKTRHFIELKKCILKIFKRGYRTDFFVNTIPSNNSMYFSSQIDSIGALCTIRRGRTVSEGTWLRYLLSAMRHAPIWTNLK